MNYVQAAVYSGNCGANGSNLTWSFNTSTAKLTISGTGAMANYSTSSRAPWYTYRASFTTITIANTVTSIGDDAFYMCANVTSVSIGTGVTSIGNSAFYNCTSLTSVTIPNGVTTIGNYAFCNCTHLASFSIPSNVTTIGSYAFSRTALTSITIPNKVTYIAQYIFYHCEELKTVTLGNKVTTIDSNAFDYCTALTSITIPSTVTAIRTRAFLLCEKLTSITIPSSVTTLGSYAFQRCKALKDIYVGWTSSIPAWNNMTDNSPQTSIKLHIPCGTRTKYGAATGWKDYTIASPASYTLTVKTNSSSYGTVKINDGATGATKSESIFCGEQATITAVLTTSNCNIDFLQWNDGVKDNPRTVTVDAAITYTAQFGTIGGNCGASGNNLTWSFNRCTGVLTISGSGAMKDYERTGENCAEYSCNTPWIAYKGDITSIVLPVGLTRIGNYAFYQCRGVTDIDLPAALLSIGNYAFAETGLQQVCIPEGVTTIGGSAFAAMCSTTAGTTPLKRVYLPNSLTSIGAYALYYNPLKFLTYPASANSFSTPYRGVYPANEVYASWKTDVPSRQGRVEAIASPKRKMHIPYGTTSLYQAKDWARIYQLVEDVDERAIDLGLSIRWASCNIGATAPEENGNFYAWGDTLTRSSFTWGTYPYSGTTTNTMTKYCTRAVNGTVDNRSTLIAFDDAAYINWGETWRMPTWTEWNELITQCTWKDTTINNISVWQVTGPNGNSIYLPKVGYKNSTSVTAGCYYWSSTLNKTNSNDQCNRALYINAANRSGAMYGLRYVGMPVRAVYRREWPSFTLTITDTPEGTPYTKAINAGSSYTLTAQEDDCHHFVQWSDGNTQNPRTVSVTADATYTAVYDTEQFTITVQAEDPTMGDVSITVN